MKKHKIAFIGKEISKRKQIKSAPKEWAETFNQGFNEGRTQALEKVDKSIKKLQENWFAEGRKQALEEVEKMIDELEVKRFKSLDEEDKLHIKGWNGSLEELKSKIQEIK